MKIFRTKDSKETFGALGMVGGFGFMMGGSVLASFFIGTYLDKRFETEPWLLIIFLIIGVVAGFTEFYKLLKKIIAKN